MSREASPAGLRVLIVEDEKLVAMMLEGMLAEMGVVVAAVSGSVEEALGQLDELDIDAAILDVNLHGETSYPVADELVARGVPFMFSTGYSGALPDDRYPDSLLLAKPIDEASLGAALAGLARMAPDASGPSGPET